MNDSTAWRRRKKGTSLNLKVNYLHVWADRMPNVLQMIQHGLKLKDIGKHYGCSATNVSEAMKGQGYVIAYLKREFKLNKH